MTLEAQEHRARRELARLQEEEQEEAERQETEAEAREQAAAQREAELDFERERLRRDQAREMERRAAERESVAFRRRWIEEANATLSAWKYNWLSPSQRKEVIEALEAEIKRRIPADEPHLKAILSRNIEVLIEPFQRQREVQEKRQRVMQCALAKLPYSTTEVERVRVTAVVRGALRRLGDDADESEMRVGAQEAIQPLCQTIEKRLLDGRLIEWAVQELPYWGRTERDQAHLRRDCAEILDELPVTVSEEEAKETLEPTIREISGEIEERQVHKQREVQKANLVEQGVAEVTRYLRQLKQNGEISPEEYLDYELRADLHKAAREELESELTGEETHQEVKDIVHDIVDEEFE